jgi:hypothetical protein
MCDFCKLTRLFEEIFRKIGVSVLKCGAFIEISIIFENPQETLKKQQKFHKKTLLNLFKTLKHPEKNYCTTISEPFT